MTITLNRFGGLEGIAKQGTAFLFFFVCLASATVHASTQSLVYREQVISIDGNDHVVHIPEGYELELLTTALDEPRLLRFADNGDLFIGSKSGHVYRLAPPYTQPEVFVTLFGYPHSVAFRKNEILIARTNGVYHAPHHPGEKKLNSDDVKLLAALPGGGGHNSRTVAVGPDGRIYLSLGLSGNCSDQYLDDSYPFNDRRLIFLFFK